MYKYLIFLASLLLCFSFLGKSQSYVQQTTPHSAAAKLFFFDRSSNGNTDRNWKIATLPASTNGTGDKIMIELFGGSHGSTSTFQQVIHMGNRGGFYGKLRTTLGEKYTSVRIRAYEQTSGAVDVYLSILSNGWKGASVKVYEGSAIIGVPPTIYENPTNVGTSPSGTLVFDSYTEIPGLVVRNNGNVGIGTDSPTSQLNVGTKTSNSPSTVAQFGIENPDSEARVLSLVNSGGGTDQSVSIDFHNRENWSSTGKIQLQQMGTNTASKMHFYTYYSGLKNRMTIDQNGYVGIGTTTPDKKLTVQGDANVGGTGNGMIKVRHVNGKSHTSTDYGNLYLNYHTTSPVLIGTNSNKAPLYVYGNVGIGTTNPDEKLTVNGTIHSSEVKVDLSVPGPDYVFESDYDLRTLAETEEYIKENKHLPEVPSAQEVEENGIELGAMNALLLKKIEELTLHIIGLEKRNLMQDEKIEEILKAERHD